MIKRRNANRLLALTTSLLGIALSPHAFAVSPDAALECSQTGADEFTLDASGSSDADGDALINYAFYVTTESGIRSVSQSSPVYVLANVAGGIRAYVRVTDSTNRTSRSLSCYLDDSGIAANSSPVAVADTHGDVLIGETITINALGNDTDVDGDVLTLVSVSGAAHGTAQLVDGQVSYTAQSAGAETLTYTLSDGEAEATSTISFNVIEAVETNTAPNTVADSVTCANTAPCTFNVLANDSDAEGDVLTLESISQPSTGVASISTDALSIRFEPASGFAGQTSLTYTATDGQIVSAATTVTITVTDATTGTGGDTAVVAAVVPVGFYVNAGTQGVLLDGSASTPTDGTLSYQWTQTGGTAVALTNPDQAVASFNAPLVDETSVYTFELTVSDGIRSSKAPLAVTVGYVDAPVVVVDSPDQPALEGSTVKLGGRAFFTGLPLTDLLWSQVAGPTVALSDPTQSNISFVAPAVEPSDEGTDLIFKLTLTDTSFGLTADAMPSDTVTITVMDNAIDSTVFSSGFNTTLARDSANTPFAFRAANGALVELTPMTINDSSARNNRPRSLPLQAIYSKQETGAGGVAQLVFELEEALPADYSWFVYDSGVEQWYDLDEGYSGISYSLSDNRRQVTLSVTDVVAVTKAASDQDGEEGVVAVISAPGQKTEWISATASVGGGSLGWLSLAALAAGAVRRRGLAALAVSAVLTGGPVAAADLEYFGGVGFGNVTFERSGADLQRRIEAGDGPEATVSGGKDSSIFKAYGGAFFAPNLGIRVGYVSLGDVDIKVGAGLAAGEEERFAEQVFDDLPHAGSGLTLALQGRFPITENWIIHDWAGVFAWQSEATLTLNDVVKTSKDSGIDFLLGAAAEYRVLQDQLGLRLELERYSQNGDGLLMLGAGAAWYFQ